MSLLYVKKKLDHFDNMECLRMQGEETSFPVHYHETFCITLIKQGIEGTHSEDRLLIGEKDEITITHPYEVHSNPVISDVNPLSFDTIYVNADVVKHFLGGRQLHFFDKKIYNPKLNELFRTASNSIFYNSNPKEIATDLNLFLQSLASFTSLNYDTTFSIPLSKWTEMNSYIDNHLTDTITLEKLASIANINKYSFARKFKSLTGMTPIGYVLMKRVICAKNEITKMTQLTDMAYKYQFTDMAHFSNTFKRFIGVSPLKFKEGIL